MSDPQASPISQLLTSLGITREDLNVRTNQMRQFLTAENAFPARVAADAAPPAGSTAKIRSDSVSTLSATTSARSFSRASSSSARDASPPPPSTPVKAEPPDGAILLRQFDSMEVVIERQRQARRDKSRGRQPHRGDRPAHPSPSPSASRAGSSLDLARDDDSGASSSTLARQSPPPLTPQQSKYYRAHTAAQSLAPPKFTPRAESPTPTRAAAAAIPLPNLHYYYPQFAPPRAEPAPKAPVTPTPIRIIKPPSNRPSPLPPSSPPPTSSPVSSSPVRGIINLVSSPGPMGPRPNDTDYDGLPYTLPPGPYSPTKPECSYAALLGQAILSSVDHRLTLQEIYDWITVVYPYFKRGETTWMNSIRHVLSTTVVFRKVTRERALGRTQWAIWDDDLPCFQDGGFRKHLCNDMRFRDKPSTSLGVKRSRAKADDTADDRRPKKARNAPSISHSIFPATRPTPHHQSYYDSCLPRPPPDLFPPLPPALVHPEVSDPPSDDGGEPSSPSAPRWTPPAPASTSSVMSSVPSLATNDANDSSSSPPISTSDIDVDASETSVTGDQVQVAGVDDQVQELDFDDVFTDAVPKFHPSRRWGGPSPKDSLQPGIQLKYAAPELIMGSESDDEEDVPVIAPRKKKAGLASPTAGFRSKSLRSTRKRLGSPPAIQDSPPRASSPPRPSTPPPKASSSYISPIRTPISHQGLHMSPSTSLAHYKSNLNPPPAYDPLKTPSKKRTVALAAAGGPPVTPRKLFTLGDSPGAGTSSFRTPKSGGSGIEPFRTPKSGSGGGGGIDSSPFRMESSPYRSSFYDTHDPASMLDEELSRLGGSPAAGLFGRQRAHLLYDSPGQTSPGQMARWW